MGLSLRRLRSLALNTRSCFPVSRRDQHTRRKTQSGKISIGDDKCGEQWLRRESDTIFDQMPLDSDKPRMVIQFGGPVIHVYRAVFQVPVTAQHQAISPNGNKREHGAEKQRRQMAPFDFVVTLSLKESMCQRTGSSIMGLVNNCKMN